MEKPVFDQHDIISDDEVTEEETIVAEAVLKYAIEINGIHCTVIQPGEDLASIARKYDMSLTELLQFNELATETQAKEGSIIFLDKKKKKYNGAQDMYIAKEGETLYDIAQEFGVQLHQLAKLNNMSDYVRLQKGTRIYLK